MSRAMLIAALGAILGACGGITEGEPLGTCLDLQLAALDRCSSCDLDGIDRQACDLFAADITDACFGMLDLDACGAAIAAGSCSAEGLWPAACETRTCATGGAYRVSSSLEVIAGFCRYDTSPSTFDEDPGDPLHPDPECDYETEWSQDGCRVIEVRDCVFPGIGVMHTEETVHFLPSGDVGWGGVWQTVHEEGGDYCEARFHMFHERT